MPGPLEYLPRAARPADIRSGLSLDMHRSCPSAPLAADLSHPPQYGTHMLHLAASLWPTASKPCISGTDVRSAAFGLRLSQHACLLLGACTTRQYARERVAFMRAWCR